MEYKEGPFDVTDGVQLFLRRWRPDPVIRPRGVVIVVHGLFDHGGRYQQFAKQLVGQGWAIYALDLRGHGKSAAAGGPVFRQDPWKTYTADLGFLANRIRYFESSLPLFILGHSLGGTIAAAYATTKNVPISGMILSAAALKYDPRAALFSVPLFLADRHDEPVFDPRLFCRNPDVLESYKSDPHAQGWPIGSSIALIGAIDRIRICADSISLPLFLLHGEADHVVPASGTREFLTMVSSKARAIHTFPGALHDLPRDEPDEFASEILAWLKPRGKP